MDPRVKDRIKRLEGLLGSERPKGKLEKACIKRQIDDLKHGHKRGLVWNEDEAQRAIDFYQFLCHWKGEWAGKPLDLELWQQELIIAPIFGWYLQDGSRRFRTGYIEIPRKNGKTTIAAGIALRGLTADLESGAEVYCAATKRDQAKLLFRDATNFIRKAEYLKRRLKIQKHALLCPKLSSSLVPLSSDANTLDGLNPHMTVVDELHAHRTRDLWDVMATASGSRNRSLLLAITTAGHDRTSVCWEQRDYSQKLLTGSIEDDSYFCFIACADEKDDPFDPMTWWKANPNLDISLKRTFIENQARKAKASPSYENTFRRLHLNQWTEAETRWLKMSDWAKAAEEFDLSWLVGERCFAGLDLSKVNDTSALVLVTEIDGDWYLVPWFWIPGDNAFRREAEHQVPYTVWQRSGHIHFTDGDVVDYSWIGKTLMEIAGTVQLEGVAYDPYNASHFAQQMIGEGLPMVEFPQSWRNLADATSEFEKLLVSGNLHHNNNPVFNWQAGNVSVRRNPSGQIRPAKPMSEDAKKIDGIAAAIMGLALATRSQQASPSVYETRGFVTL
ncbi:Terminase (plasmid) [Planctopirus limnophila DSM 3776]|uniref:Terminase n=1 Tax=Planctopirus limnophila (strain ATCC 43296 / DSM 3776 / IFAM 1008 / Mu 290) TaxID=521674 RepID=D5SZD7_PLAL2|nr:Terminase [Planctopirus limnophila DSM 3776]